MVTFANLGSVLKFEVRRPSRSEDTARVFFRIWNLGGVNQPLGVPSLLLSPSLSPFLSPPSLLSPFPPLEVGPLKCRGLGSAVSSPRPQSKLNLVHFSLKI